MKAYPLDPRTLFPRACSHCHVPLARDDFYLSQGRVARRCKRCDLALVMRSRSKNPSSIQEAQRRYRKAHPDRRYKTEARYKADLREQLLPEARHHAQEWTSAQMEIIARPTLTTKQAAALVGRTAGAVSTQRWLIAKGDPRALSKLGYDPNKQED